MIVFVFLFFTSLLAEEHSFPEGDVSFVLDARILNPEIQIYLSKGIPFNIYWTYTTSTHTKIKLDPTELVNRIDTKLKSGRYDFQLVTTLVNEREFKIDRSFFNITVREKEENLESPLIILVDILHLIYAVNYKMLKLLLEILRASNILLQFLSDKDGRRLPTLWASLDLNVTHYEKTNVIVTLRDYFVWNGAPFYESMKQICRLFMIETEFRMK